MTTLGSVKIIDLRLDINIITVEKKRKQMIRSGFSLTGICQLDYVRMDLSIS